MRLLLSGFAPGVQHLLSGPYRPFLGHLLTPGDHANRAILLTLAPFAMLPVAKNCRQDGLIRSLLVALRSLSDRCLFLAPPYTINSYKLTKAAFSRWAGEISHFGPVGYVVQPGAEGDRLPWRDFDALIFTGSQKWLAADFCGGLAQEGRQRGKYLHFCNSTTFASHYTAFTRKADSVSLACHLQNSALALLTHVGFVGSLHAPGKNLPPPVAPG